jgi:hypothetical protein
MIRAYADSDDWYLATYPELDRQEEIFIATTGTSTSLHPPLHWRIVWRAYILQNGQHVHAGWKCVEIIHDATLNRDPEEFSFRYSFRSLRGTSRLWTWYSVGWLDREFRDNLVQLAEMLPQPKETGGNCLTCVVQSLFNVIEDTVSRILWYCFNQVLTWLRYREPGRAKAFEEQMLCQLSEMHVEGATFPTIPLSTLRHTQDPLPDCGLRLRTPERIRCLSIVNV